MASKRDRKSQALPDNPITLMNITQGPRGLVGLDDLRPAPTPRLPRTELQQMESEQIRGGVAPSRVPGPSPYRDISVSSISEDVIANAAREAVDAARNLVPAAVSSAGSLVSNAQEIAESHPYVGASRWIAEQISGQPAEEPADMGAPLQQWAAENTPEQTGLTGFGAAIGRGVGGSARYAVAAPVQLAVDVAAPIKRWWDTSPDSPEAETAGREAASSLAQAASILVAGPAGRNIIGRLMPRASRAARSVAQIPVEGLVGGGVSTAIESNLRDMSPEERNRFFVESVAGQAGIAGLQAAGGAFRNQRFDYAWRNLNARDRRSLTRQFGSPEAAAAAFDANPNAHPVLAKAEQIAIEGERAGLRETQQAGLGRPQRARAALRGLNAPAPANAGMLAYHGTGARWAQEEDAPLGRPRLDKIGTGEGAQAYGWGLYFAEDPRIAGHYKEKLSENSTILVDPKGEQFIVPKGANAENLAYVALTTEQSYERARIFAEEYADPLRSKTLDVIDSWEAIGIKPKSVGEGSLYTVDIPDAVVDRMLDWDKPLMEQSADVIEALRDQGEIADGPPSDTGRQIYKDAVEIFGSERDASEYLRSLGIPGIKFLDASSRSRGEGKRNLVLFDESLARVVARNDESVPEPYRSRYADEITRRGEPVPQPLRPRTPALRPNSEGGSVRLPGSGRPRDEQGRIMRGLPNRLRQYQEFEKEREGIVADQGNYYEQQSIKSRSAANEARSADELLQANIDNIDIADQNNFAALDFAQGILKKKAAGEDVTPYISRLAKLGTAAGQLIRQFAEIKGTIPENVTEIFDGILQQHGRTMTDLQRTRHTRLATVDIMNRQKMRDAESRYEADPTEANAKAYDTAIKNANRAAIRLGEYQYSLAPRGLGEAMATAIQGNLIIPASHVANVAYNVQNIPFQFGANGIASAADLLRSKITGAPRTTMRWRVMPFLSGFKDGLREAGRQLLRGTDESQATQGERIRGFRPRMAIRQAMTGEGLAVDVNTGKVRTMDRVQRAYEGIFGGPPEVMLRLLAFGDAPFREGYKATIIDEMARLNGLEGAEAEAFKRVQRQNTDEAIQAEYLKALAQQDTWFSKKVNSFLRAAPGLEPLVRAQVPFVRTPINIVWEGVQYMAPEIPAAQAAYHYARGNNRAGDAFAAKAAMGYALSTAAALLVQQGIATGDPSGSQDPETRLRYSTQKPNTINISALGRMLKGESPEYREGDDIRDYRRAGFVGLIINAYANQADNLVRTGSADSTEDMPLPGVLHTSLIPQIGKSTLQLAMMKGTLDVLEAFNDGDFEKWGKTYLGAMYSTVVPNTIRAELRNYNEFIRSPRELPASESPWELAVRAMREKIGADYMLADYPYIRDIYGRKVEVTPPDRNGLIYHNLDITRGYSAPDDWYVNASRDLFNRTRDNRAIPPDIQDRVTFERETIRLSPQQKDRLRSMVGSARRAELDAIKSQLESMNDEERLDAVEDAHQRGRDRAVSDFVARLRSTARRRVEVPTE